MSRVDTVLVKIYTIRVWSDGQIWIRGNYIMTTPGQGGGGQGPKFHIDIEGTLYDWDEDTITVPQIRELGDLPEDLPGDRLLPVVSEGALD